ncbi:MAG: LysR family transcriptional regulator [Betaproteobacteria bacterium]|nr:LysR family transcriptional regulator [Betaproteobacteria bacterium]
MSIRNVKTNPGAVPRLPSLDLLKGFEAAARLLSFTRAGEELHLTQSAVSRQIIELEEQLGTALFQRRHRSLALTEAGQVLYAAAGQVLSTVRTATQRLREMGGQPVLSVTTSHSFAALWLVPRLIGYRRIAPDVDVRISADSRFVDLERQGFDVGLRLCRADQAGKGAVRLFGENVFPVAVPAIARLLRTPADLHRQVLLEFDQPDGAFPWLSWRQWLETAGLAGLKPQGVLRFSAYDQVVNAALSGVGVALGRSALVAKALAGRKLVAPFKGETSTERAYFAVTAPGAASRPEVKAFVDWVASESAATP